MLYEILSKSPVFRGITPAKLEELLSSLHYKIRKFKKEEVVALQGDQLGYLMVIIKGSVRAEMTDVSGRSIKIEDITAPNPIASAYIFGKQNRFPVNVTANEDIEIFCLSKDSIVELFQRNSNFLTNFLNAISNRSQFLAQKIMLLNFKTIEGKLANYILKLAAPGKELIVLPKSQTEMAKFFGVARPSLARSLKKMERDGIIKVSRQEITILNRAKLSSLVQ